MSKLISDSFMVDINYQASIASDHVCKYSKVAVQDENKPKNFSGLYRNVEGRN